MVRLIEAFQISVLVLASLMLRATLDSATAGIIRADVSDEAYLSLASHTEFDPVGRFWERITIDGQEFEWFASGVLILPDWVLTAGHVPNASGSTNVGFQLNDGEIIGFEQIVSHPVEDLALVQLSEPAVDVAPARLYHERNEIGRIGTIVGYGDFGTTATPPAPEASNRGPRRAGLNTIDGILSDYPNLPGSPWTRVRDEILVADLDYPGEPEKNLTGEELPLSLEYNVQSGDSGGGFFLEVGGQYFLAGITSAANAFDVPGDGVYSGFVRVSSYVDWIASEIAAATLTADFNSDLTVDLLDFSILKANFGVDSAAHDQGDATGDGLIDLVDFATLKSQFGKFVSVPEPSSLLVIALATALVSVWTTSRRG